jgi:hypothetical protein
MGAKRGCDKNLLVQRLFEIAGGERISNNAPSVDVLQQSPIDSRSRDQCDKNRKHPDWKACCHFLPYTEGSIGFAVTSETDWITKRATKMPK